MYLIYLSIAGMNLRSSPDRWNRRDCKANIAARKSFGERAIRVQNIALLVKHPDVFTRGA